MLPPFHSAGRKRSRPSTRKPRHQATSAGLRVCHRPPGTRKARSVRLFTSFRGVPVRSNLHAGTEAGAAVSFLQVVRVTGPIARSSVSSHGRGATQVARHASPKSKDGTSTHIGSRMPSSNSRALSSLSVRARLTPGIDTPATSRHDATVEAQLSATSFNRDELTRNPSAPSHESARALLECGRLSLAQPRAERRVAAASFPGVPRLTGARECALSSTG